MQDLIDERVVQDKIEEEPDEDVIRRAFFHIRRDRTGRRRLLVSFVPVEVRDGWRMVREF